jgi:hypothetical protein
MNTGITHTSPSKKRWPLPPSEGGQEKIVAGRSITTFLSVHDDPRNLATTVDHRDANALTD